MTGNNRLQLHLKNKQALATGISDIGLKRKKNEDTIFLDDSSQLFLLADGMGGHARGAQASQTVISALAHFLKPERIKRKSQEVTAVSGVPLPLACYIPVIEEAISETNFLLYSKNKNLIFEKYMGTTIVGLSLVDDDHALWFHVGDSRIYLWRNSNLTQVTQDHSLHARWVRGGKNEMEPPKNIITKALGLYRKVVPDIAWERRRKNDIYMLCSDGLTDMVNDDQIEEIVKGGKSNVGKIANNLVDAALEAGGKDNVSLIVCKVKR